MNYTEIVKIFDTIAKHLDTPELLAQLAEEAAELGHAALKLRRAMTGTNPTPVTPEEAMEKLLEEIGDLFNCIDVLEHTAGLDPWEMTDQYDKKLVRWAERLEQAEHGNV